MTMPSLIWGSPQWMSRRLVLLGVAAAHQRVELRPGDDKAVGQTRRGDPESGSVSQLWH